MLLPSFEVVISNEAYLCIIAETYERIGTETGGTFLGRFFKNRFYIFETIDPGPNSVYQYAYHSNDLEYTTHLVNKIARVYKNPIEIVGLWHRHPGNLSTFSSIDHPTNQAYAELNDHGAISAIVNLDPEFQITFYYVPKSLKYEKVDLQISTDLIPREFLEKKTPSDYFRKPTKSTTYYKKEYISQGKIRLFDDPIDKRHERKKLIRIPSIIRVFIRKPKIRIGDDDFFDPNTNKSPSKIDEVFQLIRNEIEYLYSQNDYSFHIKGNKKGQIIINLKYYQKMKEYPKTLAFLFGIDTKKQGYVQIRERTYPYSNGFIHNYINTSLLIT